MSSHSLTAPTPEPRRTRRSPGLSPTTRPGSLPTWYLGLVPYWMNAKPGVKRRLLLRTHEWIIDRVLAPEVSLGAAITDLGPDGELTRALTALVPADDAAEWRHFIDVVVANLRHALQLPVTRRNEAWLRWLFLIPYSAAPAGA